MPQQMSVDSCTDCFAGLDDAEERSGGEGGQPQGRCPGAVLEQGLPQCAGERKCRQDRQGALKIPFDPRVELPRCPALQCVLGMCTSIALPSKVDSVSSANLLLS